VSDGQTVVGVSETTMDPPNLFTLNLKSREWTLLTDLNPEYREIQLGKVERIQWANRYGSQCAGFLIEPVGYEPGKRYPMVYLSVRPNDVFISDAVYTTAYAPQSLANAGFVVVVSQYPADNKIPKGMFPGEMSEAYNWMAMVESAIDLLADRGMVDRNNVGIAGFSRTSWLTDFTLTHSSYKFAAASSADSGVYTYGFYFMYNNRSIIEGMESEVGGPPYGETFKYWQEYAPPFNAEKVQAPVLMEYRDTGQSAFEFFTALSRLGKAVDLYCYPNGEHPLDTPWERIASLQRNVDWFRFWMQGYEGKAPDYDVSQFVRWRALRSKREASSDAAAPRLP
jgi:dipeptidyl aminopeptidase/acylaminoacyl peptidase